MPACHFVLLIAMVGIASAFLPPAKPLGGISRKTQIIPSFHMFGKVFEDEGPLGKGITVGKIQVALTAGDRSPSSILGLLERKARADDDSSYGLARSAYDVCMALLRKEDDWVGACSQSQWFKGGDSGKAESTFNTWADKEGAKFEKEYIPESSNDDKVGGSTTVVVSMIIEIQGDATEFDGAGYTREATKKVLSNIASDCMVEEGDNVNAVEIFWTPSDPEEVLSKNDMIIDFPELIDM